MCDTEEVTMKSMSVVSQNILM